MAADDALRPETDPNGRTGGEKMGDWKVGDVVQLNSGGPTMTVLEVDEEDRVVSAMWITEASHGQGRYPFDCVREPVYYAVGPASLSRLRPVG
jgi:uncharacterized protein YodC (DUF2158 family)